MLSLILNIDIDYLILIFFLMALQVISFIVFFLWNK